MQNKTYHWHILGAGSIGLLFAYYLAKAGHKVTLLGREKVQQQTYVTAIINQQAQKQAIELSCSSNCTNINLLLVTVKAQATAKALASVNNALNHDSQVFLLQNGLGQLDEIQLANSPTIVPAITQAGAEKTAPLSVIVHAKGQTFLPILKQAQHPLQCELPVTMLTNFIETQWQKLAINAVINPLTAIHNCRNGDVLKLKQFEAIAKSVITELVAIAKAKQVSLNADQLITAIILVAKHTAGNSSSMREDIRHKKQTEIDFINGYIVNQGRLLGISTPSNLMLLKQVQQLQG